MVINVKTVGKSGQISLGKSLAGMDFIMEEMPGGDILLRRAVVVPANERWLHAADMQARLEDAQNWMHANPAQDTNLDALESRLKAE